MCLNATKTKDMFITLRDVVTCEVLLKLNNTIIDTVDVFKLLGFEIDSHLQFANHVERITKSQHENSWPRYSQEV